MNITTNTVYHNAELGTWFYLTVWHDDDPAHMALNLRYAFTKPANLANPELYTCMSNFANLRERTCRMLHRLGANGAVPVLKIAGDGFEIDECTTLDPASSPA